MKELFKFSAQWCGPCQHLAMNMKGEDFGVPVTEVDIDDQLELAAKHGIRSVPTLILFKDGVEVARKNGVMSAKQIQDFVNNG